MNEQLEQQIQADFPFMKMNKIDGEENLYRRWGCDCDDGWYELIHDMCQAITDRYAKEGSVSLIVFNLGYLPGGDHSLSTKAETTIEALEKGLALLHEGGMISLLIYSGGDSGFEEKNQVLAWLRELRDDKYTVLVEAFYNKPNNPPLPVYILKNETA